MKKVVALDVQGLLTSVEQQLAANLHVEDIGMKASSLSWTMPTNTSSPVMTLSTTTPTTTGISRTWRAKTSPAPSH